MNNIEKWGIALPLDNPISDEERELVAGRYNTILDRDDVLTATIEKHQLTDYYGQSSVGAVVPLLREDSFIELPGNGNLHVLINGKRKDRKLRATVSQTLAAEFVKAVREMGGR